MCQKNIDIILNEENRQVIHPVCLILFLTFPPISVLVQSIKGILVGQKTAIFKKNKLPEYEHVSFSLLYGEKTLGILNQPYCCHIDAEDIICKDGREYDIWYTGMRSLTVEPQALLAGDEQVDLSRIPQKVAQDSLEISFKGKQTVVIKREGTWGGCSLN